MQILKIIGLIIVSIIALLLLVALFIKKDYAIKRTVVIQKPRAQVFNYIKYLKNQNEYSKWAGLDPGMKKTFTGTDATVGFISAWDSPQKNVGAGEQEIKEITANKRVDYEIRFIRPFKSTSPAYMSLEDVANGATEVTWEFSGTMKYPMNIMLLLMNIEKSVGEDLETGLQNLKAKLES